MNTVDYKETIDCGLCHEPVDKEDRAQVQGRSKTGAIYYWPAFIHQDCIYNRGRISIYEAHRNSRTYIARAKAKLEKVNQMELKI
tara:strand:- start:878 stop:1132 length:255 start_codon:yes stop_codon:yes gene_type:complete